jgi:hypothetical protein
MGQEILYCSKCQARLLGADFEKGLAFRIANQTVCRACAQMMVDTLPPVRETPIHQTASIPVRPRTTVRHAAPEKRAAVQERIQAERVAAPPEGACPDSARDSLQRRAWKEVKKIRAETARRGDANLLEAVDRAIAEASASIGLVAWWPFDEEGGTSVPDASGRGHTGTVRGKADWRPSEGRSGGAIAFDGSTSCVVVASRGDLNITGGITLAAWCRPVNFDTNRRILQKGREDNQYRITVDQIDPNSNVRRFRFDLKNAGRLDVPLPASRPWMHVAATYDRKKMTVYFNGIPSGERAATAAIATTNDPLVIGTKFEGAPSGDHYLGLLDEIQIYDRALTPEDAATLARPPE